MIRVQADVAVIGGGPAGLSAATAAARSGAAVHLLDAGAAGGQYWMQGPTRTRQSAAGAAAIEAAQRAGVHFHLNAEVWAIFPERRISAAQGDESLEVAARTIVIASGAHDRVAPFPGWTLPGVMTAGAAQRLAKLDETPAGRHVAIAGSGPFLLAVAQAVTHAGAELTAFVEAQRPSRALAAHLMRSPRRWIEIATLLRAAGGSRTQRHFGWVVVEALGDKRVEAIRIAPLGRGGAIDREAARTIAGIDALIVGWGFRPSIDLTALLRCRHLFDETRGGWYCAADPLTGRTSVDGVFAAGEIAGVAGALPARLAGELAGLAAAAHAGFGWPAPGQSVVAAGRRLRRARAFASGLNAIFAPPAAIHTLAADDTIVCRCEEVTAGEIKAAAAEGAATVSGVKRLTRAGMGACQGRICGWAVAHAVAPAVAEAGFNAPRIPVRPVPLSLVERALAEDEPE
jgi:NADPH-dependent 2,4-dienoyl-CoA reductase/sulfur reductase-like enzyme